MHFWIVDSDLIASVCKRVRQHTPKEVDAFPQFLLTKVPLFPARQAFHTWISPERVPKRGALHHAGRRNGCVCVSVCRHKNVLINREVAGTRDVMHKACDFRAEACRSDSC